MKWKDYPAGSELHLFYDTLTIWVCKEGNYWSALVYLGDGVLTITNSKDREKVKKDAEKWIIEECKRILEGEKRS